MLSGLLPRTPPQSRQWWLCAGLVLSGRHGAAGGCRRKSLREAAAIRLPPLSLRSGRAVKAVSSTPLCYLSRLARCRRYRGVPAATLRYRSRHPPSAYRSGVGVPAATLRYRSRHPDIASVPPCYRVVPAAKLRVCSRHHSSARGLSRLLADGAASRRSRGYRPELRFIIAARVAPAGRQSGQQTLSGLPPRTPMLQGGACCDATLSQQTPPFRNLAINTLNKLASAQTGIGYPAANLAINTLNKLASAQTGIGHSAARGGFAPRPSAIPTTSSLKRRAASLGLPPQTPPLVRGSRAREVSSEPALARGSCPLENPRTRPRRPNGACSPVP